MPFLTETEEQAVLKILSGIFKGGNPHELRDYELDNAEQRAVIRLHAVLAAKQVAREMEVD